MVLLTYLQVVEGTATVTVQRRGASEVCDETLLHGESALITAQDSFAIGFASPHVRLLVVTGTVSADFKGGLESLFEQHGTRINSKHYFGGGSKGPQSPSVTLQEVQQWAQTVDAEFRLPL